MRTLATAIATRSVSDLAMTSTMRTWPASSRWLREGGEDDIGNRDRELLMFENCRASEPGGDVVPPMIDEP
ncbi:hypothetical protein D3C87_2033290 [compost metagenome]